MLKSFFFPIFPATRHDNLFFAQSFNYSSRFHEPPGPAVVFVGTTEDWVQGAGANVGPSP